MTSNSKMGQEYTELKSEYKDLAQRVQKLEKQLYVAITIASIFSVTGGFMVKKFVDLNEKADTIERKLKEAEVEYKNTRDKAVKEVVDELKKVTGRYDKNFVTIKQRLGKKAAAKSSGDIIPYHTISDIKPGKGDQ